MSLLSKMLTFGDKALMRSYSERVERVGSFEAAMRGLSDADLAARTAAFRERHDRGESLDELLPEAFAAVREASLRTLGMRHFDVQVMGGIVLHEGRVAEMATGEGKTLVSILAGYLNAIPGAGVHVVTVNDYLAGRDAEQTGRVYRSLGMEVGLLRHDAKGAERATAYRADVTYGTNTELGFDYLRDNMATRAADRVQRGHRFAIVDEADSILIDEARTPLIISGAGVKAVEAFQRFARVVPFMVEGEDFEKDEAKKLIAPTAAGLYKIESILGIDDIYADATGKLASHLLQALKAQFLFRRDVDYVVADGEVKIVDEFTGRIMEGRRYSEGLHQALEAKEGVRIREESRTIASITLQNYFRLYDKLSGMTGTAMTEDAELRQIYGMPVVAVPTNRPVVRDDLPDLVYRTAEAKLDAVVEETVRRHSAGQPVLIGTVSVEGSEKLSRMLTRRGVGHEVLNAKHHEREAAIVAQAGRLGAVTIATNMAGRGTDILLGGNPSVLARDILRREGFDPDAPQLGEDGAPNPAFAPAARRAAALESARAVCSGEQRAVLAAGGLCVIGTERHESRRIDNQLRGRAGRQGDPGSSQFFLSLEDDLMRLFGGSKMVAVAKMMERARIPDDTPIQANTVSRAVEGAQRQMEGKNFGIRKNVLEYDEAMNLHRAAVYAERNAVLDGKDLAGLLPGIVRDAVADIVAQCCEGKGPEGWDYRALRIWLEGMTGLDEFDFSPGRFDDPARLEAVVADYLLEVCADKARAIGEGRLADFLGQLMLRVIDERWMAHLQDMDYLKAGIGLRAVAQRDPLVEYKNDAYRAFGVLTAGIYDDFLRLLLRLNVGAAPAVLAGGNL